MSVPRAAEHELSALAQGFSLRPACGDDAEAVAEVIISCNTADVGKPDFSVEELGEEWQAVDLRQDTRVVVAPDGQIVAYVAMAERHHVVVDVDGYVHPAWTGRGLGSRLLHWAEVWAREHMVEAPPDLRVTLNHGLYATNSAGRRLLEAHGFASVRQYLRMAIDLQQAPAVPRSPDGITLRPFVPGQDERATFETMEDAFRDHWGRLPGTFDKFLRRTQTPSFDPGLWLLACDQDGVVGVTLGEKHPDIGYIATVGVLRPWRGRGIALALLRQAFAEFYRRSAHHVELMVDSKSLTGAPRLYHRVGMDVMFSVLRYQKELRPGKELG